MTRHPIQLTGLTAAPSQVRGAFRLVPLLRDQPCTDLRLYSTNMQAGLKAVLQPNNTTYFAFVPHALVLEWDIPNTQSLAALGGQVIKMPKRPKKTD